MSTRYDPDTGAYLGEPEPVSINDGTPEPDPTYTTPDPRILSREHYDRRILEGASRETAASESLNLLARAAMAGDQRVIVVDNARHPLTFEPTPSGA
jgi:hypothetical protein